MSWEEFFIEKLLSVCWFPDVLWGTIFQLNRDFYVESKGRPNVAAVVERSEWSKPLVTTGLYSEDPYVYPFTMASKPHCRNYIPVEVPMTP